MRKRLIALAMVIVLALSLGTMALATQNHPTVTPGSGSATITIKALGARQYTGSINGTTLEDGLKNLTSTALFTDAQDWYNPAIIHDAMYSLYGFATAGGNFSDLSGGTYRYDGVDYTASSATAVPGYAGYFLLKTVPDVPDPSDENTPKTQYHYLYIGKDWVYSDNNGDVYVYMCDYALNGQNINLTYEVQTAAWATFDPII